MKIINKNKLYDENKKQKKAKKQMKAESTILYSELTPLNRDEHLPNFTETSMCYPFVI